MYTIYRLFDISSPNITKYIGQTKEDLRIRVSKHKASARQNRYKRNSYLYNWIKSIDFNVGIEKIIDGIETKTEADNLEVFYIKTYKSKYPLVNTTLGGDKTTTLFYDKNGNAKKVIQYSKEGQFLAVYNSMREAADKTGVKASLISGCCCFDRIKSAGGYIWRFYSNNFLETIPPLNENKKSTHEKYKKLFGHVIIQLSLNNDFIKKWESMHDVERNTNMHRAGIYYALKHTGIAYGYKWIKSKRAF